MAWSYNGAMHPPGWVAAAAMVCGTLLAQSAPNIEGNWEGSRPDNTGFSTFLRISKDTSGAFTGTLDAVDVAITGLRVPVAQEGQHVTLDLPAYGLRFEGTASGDTIAGKWNRRGSEIPYVFRRATAPPPLPPAPPDLTRYMAKIEDPRRWRDAFGTQVPIPPQEHPRLYLRARDLGDLRRRLDDPVLQPIWRSLLKHASDNVQIRLETGALRYLLDRDAALARRTVADGLSTLEHSTFDMKVEDISRAIGRMMVTGAIVYDWCYPVLTAGEKQRFQQQEVRLAKLMESGYPPFDGDYLTSHGSEWMIMRDLLSAGVALYDEFPEMYLYAANRFFKGHLPARNFWYEGQAFHQGSAYAETRVSSELYPLFIFDRMGFPRLYNPSQQFVPYLWIYMRRPDGQLLRSGDGQSITPRLRSLLIASYYGDGYVLGDYLRNPGVGEMNEIFELLWRDPDLQPLPRHDLPLSRYMGSPFGWMVARTAWDAESVIAEMKVNIYNFADHQHMDAGAFQIYYKGPLAIDSGLYEGANGDFGSPHHVNYYQRTIAHNSLLVYNPDEQFVRYSGGTRNDGGQRWLRGEPKDLAQLFTRGYQTGKVLGQGFGPDPQSPNYTYLEGDITQAYSEKVKEVKRSFVFLNLTARAAPDATRAALIVFDRVVATNPAFKKYWLLHSMEEPAIVGNTTSVALSERGWTGRLRNTTLLPKADNTELVKVGGPGKEFWVFGQNYPNHPDHGDPADYEIGAWRIELSPRRPQAVDYFLNVMEVGAAKVGGAVEKLEAPGLVGARVADRVIWFSAGGARAKGPVSFTVKAAGTLEYLVTDLVSGTWQVWRDGRIAIPAVTVSEDAGTLYFTGPAGRWELRR
jgi:Heparinase II C-terminal domain/Heparinase II/III-like protein